MTMYRNKKLLFLFIAFFLSPFSAYAQGIFIPTISDFGKCLKVQLTTIDNGNSPFGLLPNSSVTAFPMTGASASCVGSGSFPTVINVGTLTDGTYNFTYVNSGTNTNFPIYVVSGLWSLSLPVQSLYASSSNLIVLGVTDLGTGLLAIFTVVIALIVGVFLFRKGIHWMKHAGGNPSAENVAYAQKNYLGSPWSGKDSFSKRTFNEYVEEERNR